MAGSSRAVAGGVPGSITASLMSRGLRRTVGRGADLHLVDLADEQHVGARAGVGRLGAVRVGAVVVVVLQLESSPTRCRRPCVRTSKVAPSSATSAPAFQVTPTAPYPVTGSGVLTTWLPPSSAPILVRALQRARRHLARSRPRGVSWYSSTSASTGAVGTTDVCCVSRVYAANAATGRPPAACCEAWRAPRTTSRLITVAAGVSTASTTPRASSCWQAVTKRALLGRIVGYSSAGEDSHE